MEWEWAIETRTRIFPLLPGSMEYRRVEGEAVLRMQFHEFESSSCSIQVPTIGLYRTDRNENPSCTAIARYSNPSNESSLFGGNSCPWMFRQSQ